MDKQDNLKGVLETLWRYRKAIFRLGGIALIGSIVVSLFLPTYYKSSTVFYPANASMASAEQIFGGAKETGYFGSDEDVDRIFTIANSNAIAEYLISRYNLYTHYDIDSTKPISGFLVREKFSNLYNVTKTKHDAIELSVEDKDPKVAMQLVKAARDQINEVGLALIKENQSSIVEALKKNISSKELSMKILSDSLVQLRKTYGIYDPKTQTEQMSQLVTSTESQLAEESTKLEVIRKSGVFRQDTIALIEAKVKGLEAKLATLTSSDSKSKYTLDNLNRGKGLVESLADEYEKSSKQLVFDKERLKVMDAVINARISTIYTIEEAETPVIKSRPHRTLIVAAALVVTLFFAVFGVLIYEYYGPVLNNKRKD